MLWSICTTLKITQYLLLFSAASGQKSSEEESQKNLWLFNIAEDPEERNDLSDEEPDTVKMMLDSLAQINVTAVTPFFPPKDPLANPELLGGVWGPWQ